MLNENTTLILASHNEGKIREIKNIVEKLGFQVQTAAALGFTDPEETGTTFEENALLKARYIAGKLSRQEKKSWILADDSGMCVEALDDRPGVYSARWAEQIAGGLRTFSYAFDRISQELKEGGIFQENAVYPAKMMCVIALMTPEGEEICFEGTTEGNIRLAPRGDKGFGYDPIFTPLGSEYTFGQMTTQEKEKFSHRGQALRLLQEYFNGAK